MFILVCGHGIVNSGAVVQTARTNKFSKLKSVSK